MPDAVPAFVWVGALPSAGTALLLEESAAHRVARVCRARVGDRISLSDGRGGIARARVARLTSGVTVEIENVDHRGRDATAVLLCGAPEGQRFDWLVEKLAELGVARIRPIDCARARWAPGAVRPDRWQRLAVAALEQSRSRHLLEVEPPAPLPEALAAETTGATALVADPDGAPAHGFDRPESGLLLAAVGPAEGFEEGERASLAARGFRGMRLSENRLRTETAALAWASWWASSR